MKPEDINTARKALIIRAHRMGVPFQSMQDKLSVGDEIYNIVFEDKNFMDNKKARETLLQKNPQKKFMM